MKRRPQAKKSAPKKAVARKKPAPRPTSARKAAPKAPAAKARGLAPARANTRTQPETYTPKPIAGVGWAAFRYPLQ